MVASKGGYAPESAEEKRYLKDGKTVAFLTLSLDVFFSIIVVDTHGRKDVVTLDVPGAFLHAKLLKYENGHEIVW